MINNKSYLHLAATAVTSAIIASLATFFITKHALNKKEHINNPISLNNTITTEQKKTTDDIDIQSKKQPTDEENKNIKEFNKIVLNSQEQFFDEIHEKNLDTILEHINKSKTIAPNSKVMYKTNGEPFQNILVKDYYEIETDKVRTVFLPTKPENYDNIQKFCNDVLDKLNEKIGSLSKKEFKIVKEIIDACRLSCSVENIVNKSWELNDNDEEIAGFLISEYTLSNNTKSYRNEVVTFQ